jgi:predicted metal-binding transcription factor (methanogenesis marker protein 9)
MTTQLNFLCPIKRCQEVDEDIKELLHEKSKQYKQTRLFDFGGTLFSLVSCNCKIVVPGALQKSGV